MSFKGVFPAIITPFNRKNKAVDTDRLKVLIELLDEKGVDGFVIAGSTGEAPYLTRDERRLILKTAIEATNRVIIAGTGGVNLKETLNYSIDADKLGVDALLIVTPYYYKVSEKALIEYYKEIKRNVKTPIILYNIPQLSGNKIPFEVAIKLIDGDKIIGIKDSSGDLKYMLNILYSLNSGYIFCGCDPLLYPSLICGVHGLILASLNLITKKIIEIRNLINQKMIDKALTIFKEVYPILNAIFEYGPLIVKLGFEYLGIDMGVCREPMNINSIPLSVINMLKNILPKLSS